MKSFSILGDAGFSTLLGGGIVKFCNGAACASTDCLTAVLKICY